MYSQILFPKSLLCTLTLVAALSKLSSLANSYAPSLALQLVPSPLLASQWPFPPASIAQCDFEDNSKPFGDWTQVSTDDGDWIRASGPSPMGSIGPPGGYPNGGEEA